MTQIKVFSEGDKVILDLGSRRTDMLISVDAAYRLAAAIEEKISEAEREAGEVFAGKQWGLKVESFDGQVGFKFFPPEECAVTRVPLPVRFLTRIRTDGQNEYVNVAQRVADMIKFKAQQAENKMRFTFQPAGV